MSDLDSLRQTLRAHHLADETDLLNTLRATSKLDGPLRDSISGRAAALIEDIRADENPALLEVFLAEYGLSTREGVALMCLAEALMRIPDPQTMDELIEDKIAPSSWSDHMGHSGSVLVNASTWGLMLTGKVLNEEDNKGLTGVLRGLVKRLGEPVIRTAVKAAMKELGAQFVLGETIQDAITRGQAQQDKGFTYSYDMLGEAALTASDADSFFNAYRDAILELSAHSTSSQVAENPGISIKLSALHPRYEVSQKARVMSELVDRTLALTLLARNANMGLNIDAEEADRLDLSLDVIEAVLKDERLAGWDGFGVVVQAYGKRASFVLDWLHALAEKLDRKIMVRLVKGAYWDSEIKQAQVEGLADFPVFTRKSATDVSYMICSEKLLGMTDRIYPQFATHNAHTVAAILEMAPDGAVYEFQRLHGMGEALHRLTMDTQGTRCRIYAPVGPHRDLLAYLVRRLLENGANSSFVNQIVDENTPARLIARDPFEAMDQEYREDNKVVLKPAALFGPGRPNSKGWDLRNRADLADIDDARQPFADHVWTVTPITASPCATDLESVATPNPARPDDLVAQVQESTPTMVDQALDDAKPWTTTGVNERAKILFRAADLYEENFGEIFAILTREAGKTPMDAIAELREAVDFLRYYALQAANHRTTPARGVFVCVSPWNFPLAIFTGQIAAALAVGNAVIAKPAEQTPVMAWRAVQLLRDAGVPPEVLQLLPGKGSVVGQALVSDPRVDGVCFTGSTLTAQRINRAMAEHGKADAPLIAETGGLNAMIVDSTALPEQAVKDIIASAFQSAGQRCSALRVLYIQEDIADSLLKMLFGAMDEMVITDPWSFASDTGPVIDETARAKINAHIVNARADGRVLKQLQAPGEGTFVAPTVIKVSGIGALAEEIFGPVLHVATFKADDLGRVVDDINASGFGLTFGLHTRIDDRVAHVTSRLKVGNMYVNRNQIGAIVGSQPFGGEGLSGTGPKAGGPAYLESFVQSPQRPKEASADSPLLSLETVQAAIDAAPDLGTEPLSVHTLPGPTGESNVLSDVPRGLILCLGPTVTAARQQAEMARASGCPALVICPGATAPGDLDGALPRELLSSLEGFAAVALWGEADDLRAARKALAAREGALLPLFTDHRMARRCRLERHLCIDTTAAGGNAQLLASSG